MSEVYAETVWSLQNVPFCVSSMIFSTQKFSAIETPGNSLHYCLTRIGLRSCCVIDMKYSPFSPVWCHKPGKHANQFHLNGQFSRWV